MNYMTEMPTGWKPMLSAKDFDVNHLNYAGGLMGSDKFDGIRNCQHPELGGVSRKMEIIPNVNLRRYFDRPELAGLDGEFIWGEPTHPDVRRRSQAAWSRHDGPHPTDDANMPIDFYVFDDFSDPSLPKVERYKRSVQRIRELNDPHIKLVYHTVLRSVDDLNEAEADAVNRNFEGLMVGDMRADYKFGRATAGYDLRLKKQGIFLIPELRLGKIKRFQDEEGTIVGYEEEEFNGNEAEKDAFGRTKRSSAKAGKSGKGTLGAFILTNPKYPKPFKCGSGLTAKQRLEYWAARDTLLGQQVTYKFQPSGMMDVPQFTVFIDIRLD